jgi:hypothetical protein
VTPRPATSTGARVPRRYAPLVFALLLTGCMTFVVSGVTTLINIGVPADFLWRWGRAWLPTWAIAYPVMLVLRPIVQRTTDRITG